MNIFYANIFPKVEIHQWIYLYTTSLNFVSIGNQHFIENDCLIIFLDQYWLSTFTVKSDASFFSGGMIVRDFKGIPSLQEVECSARAISRPVLMCSIKLFKQSNNELLVKLTSSENTCKTYTEFASCTLISSGDRRGSAVRTLVSDWSRGRSIGLGCNGTCVLTHNDHPLVFSWSINAHMKSKFT